MQDRYNTRKFELLSMPTELQIRLLPPATPRPQSLDLLIPESLMNSLAIPRWIALVCESREGASVKSCQVDASDKGG